jgi:hypothetical protein
MTLLEPSNAPHRVADDPAADPDVNRRLEQMFGASLFGGWPELTQRSAAAPRRHRGRRRWWLLSGGLLLALTIWATRALLQPGLQRTAANEREQYASDLRAFIKDGDLEHAQRYVSLVRGSSPASAARPFESGEPHVDLLVKAEALLYRYYDADAQRLTRIAPILQRSAPRSPQVTLASLTVVSREERLLRLAEIERLKSELPNDNEVEHLFATAQEHAALRRGVHGGFDPKAQDAKPPELDQFLKAASESWARSAKLGPAWLGHRWEQAWFEQGRAEPETARRVAAEIVRTDPDSTWAQLAVTAFAPPRETNPTSVRGDAGVAAPTPVQTYFKHLQTSLLAQQRGDLAQANQSLRDAMAVVHYQVPFLLDAFDWFLAARQPNLAQQLANAPEWPRGSDVAAQELELLSAFIARSSSGVAPGATPPKAPTSPKHQRSAARQPRARRSK